MAQADSAPADGGDENSTGADVPPREPTLVTLLWQLLADAEALLIQELMLLRAEIGENIGRMFGGVVLLLFGSVIVAGAGLAFVAALTVFLARFMALWQACCLTGAGAAAIGLILLWLGQRLVRRAALIPHRTLQSWRDTARWAQEEFT